ncbi:MAG: TlyA family RNA methyltransferase [Clostridiales bacterium]|nr:TlyA family RNA methyltransferase [Clostridiales bacterium]
MHDKGLAESREKAKRLIMAGSVYIDEVRVSKPGTTVDSESNILIKGNKLKYVSRGGLKLEKAIELYPIVLQDFVCMDIGASTGGFTDCMLQNNAKKVYAIDVGYGQLDWKLRNHESVVNMEKTNIRYLEYEMIGEKIDFFSIDVAFISIDKVIPVLNQFVKETSQLVVLIKPQFEAGREKVKKNGVVKEISVHEEVLENSARLLFENNWNIVELTYSPIKGPKGNIEFLAYCERSQKENKSLFDFDLIKDIVTEAHNLLF